MSIRLLCYFLIVIFIPEMTGQNAVKDKYHKIKINITARKIQDLTRAGLETDHGIYVKNRSFTSDFSDKEIEIIKNLGFDFEMLIHDVEEYYANHQRASSITSGPLQWRNNCYKPANSEYNYNTPLQYKSGSMGGYFTLQELYSILDSMAAKYPKLITAKQPIKDFKTTNGKPIYYIKVSDHVDKDESNEPKVLYTALHHAREPNSLSQMIFYLWYVLENYEKDPMIKKIVDQTQMYFIPCVNPDGYELNQKNNPNGGGLWRKNAWKNNQGDLVGVDLNRNYGYTWGKDNTGSSPNPNSLTFRGLAPFSEPETQAVRAFCLDHDFKIALNYHTFGNYLIYPGNDLTNLLPQTLFVNMGKVMNRENNFAIGTDMQTVGYTVNGDSDNWMYGESAEKNRIFAYTPEVGPSFWPPAIDIDYLNKSCMWMNISTALLTLSYYEAEEVSTSHFLEPDYNTVHIKVTRAGLKEGNVTITLNPESSGVKVIQSERQISLPPGKDSTMTFKVELQNGSKFTDGINFNLIVDNDGIQNSTIIKKRWSEYPFKPIFSDIKNDTTLYQSTNWKTTATTFKSAPTSFTDSPNGLYPAKYKASITIKEPFDLSNVTHALLQFDAKWDIEDNFDFVQVMASKDNKDFIPLCGLYTDTGTKDQSLSSPLYDGVQSDWVREEIDLSAFLGNKNVWIRFYIQTDEFEQRDGFYFDNLEIKVASKTSSTDDDENQGITVIPNILSADNQITINGLKNNDLYRLEIFNINGQSVFDATLSGSQPDVTLYHMSNGIYFYTISNSKANRKHILGRGKLVKM